MLAISEHTDNPQAVAAVSEMLNMFKIFYRAELPPGANSNMFDVAFTQAIGFHWDPRDVSVATKLILREHRLNSFPLPAIIRDVIVAAEKARLTSEEAAQFRLSVLYEHAPSGRIFYIQTSSANERDLLVGQLAATEDPELRCAIATAALTSAGQPTPADYDANGLLIKKNKPIVQFEN